MTKNYKQKLLRLANELDKDILYEEMDTKIFLQIKYLIGRIQALEHFED